MFNSNRKAQGIYLAEHELVVYRQGNVAQKVDSQIGVLLGRGRRELRFNQLGILLLDVGRGVDLFGGHFRLVTSLHRNLTETLHLLFFVCSVLKVDDQELKSHQTSAGR